MVRPVDQRVVRNSPPMVSRVTAGEIFVVCCVVIVLTWLNAVRSEPLTPDHPTFQTPGDHHKYIEMARLAPGEFRVAPFCRRIGVPAIVHVIGGDPEAAFRWVSAVAVVVAGALTYWVARAMGFERSGAACALLTFFSMGWAARWPLVDFWLPDGAVLACVAAGILCIQRANWLALAVVMALGAMVKEAVLLAAPLAFTTPGAWRMGGILLRLAAVAPAILVTVVLSLAIPAGNNDRTYVASLPVRLRQVDRGIDAPGGWERLKSVVSMRAREFGWKQVHAMTTEPFGVFAVGLALVGLWQTRWLLRLAPLGVLAYVQLLAATDTQRLVVFACLPVCLAAAAGWVWWNERMRMDPWPALVLPLVLALLNLWNPGRVAAPAKWQAMVCAAVIAALWARSRFRVRRLEK